MNAQKAEKRFVVGIAGGSGSGKTTLSKRVVEESARSGIDGQIFSLDRYYHPLDHLTLEQRSAYNFDHPQALDLDLACGQLNELLEGQSIRQPIYDFKNHTRCKDTELKEPTRLIVVEGLYALQPARLLALYDCRIFIATSVATAVLRRVQRDVLERGRDIEGAKHQILTSVLPMYENYVRPTQKNAHFSIDWEGEKIPEKATEGLVRMVRDYFR